MKAVKTSAIVSLCLFASIACATDQPQQVKWRAYGNPDFSNTTVKNPTLAFSPSGTAYAVLPESQQVVVMAMNNKTWTQVGNGIPEAGGEGSVHVAPIFGQHGSPYVLVYAYPNGLVLEKYNFSTLQWSPVSDELTNNIGSPAFHHIAMSHGTVYAFDAADDVTEAGDHSDSVNLFKLTTTTSGLGHWTLLATKTLPVGLVVRDASFAIDSNGTPYAAYTTSQDQFVSTNLAVVRYNNNTWQQVGGDISNQYRLVSPTLAFTASNIPYVSYVDGLKNGTSSATVVKLNDNAWTVVGNADFISNDVSQLSFAISQAGMPYVAYTDDNGGITTMGFDGKQWVVAGNPNFGYTSNVYWYYFSNKDMQLVAGPSKNNLFVVYGDALDGGYASVDKYNATIPANS